MLRGLIAGIIAAAILASCDAVVTRLLAHDWYPTECCGGWDCAPITSFDAISDPGNVVTDSLTPNLKTQILGFTVTTIHGTVVVPQNFPRQRSKDGRWHACYKMPSRFSPGKPTLRCLFEPDSM